MSGQLGVGHFRPLTDQVQEVMGEDVLQTGRPVGRDGVGRNENGERWGWENGERGGVFCGQKRAFWSKKQIVAALYNKYFLLHNSVNNPHHSEVNTSPPSQYPHGPHPKTNCTLDEPSTYHLISNLSLVGSLAWTNWLMAL